MEIQKFQKIAGCFYSSPLTFIYKLIINEFFQFFDPKQPTLHPILVKT